MEISNCYQNMQIVDKGFARINIYLQSFDVIIDVHFFISQIKCSKIAFEMIFLYFIFFKLNHSGDANLVDKFDIFVLIRPIEFAFICLLLFF